VHESSEALIDDGIDLSGHRILVVEGDLATGSALCSDLKRYGATVLGPAPTSHYAYLLLMGRRGVDSAVLHINSAHRELFELAESLRQRGVPMIFATDGDNVRPDAPFGDAPCFQRPLKARELAETINRLMQNGPTTPPPVRTAEEPPAMPRLSLADRLDRAIARALHAGDL
jgi:DNA-binding response OmpR family regulator